MKICSRDFKKKLCKLFKKKQNTDQLKELNENSKSEHLMKYRKKKFNIVE